MDVFVTHVPCCILCRRPICVVILTCAPGDSHLSLSILYFGSSLVFATLSPLPPILFPQAQLFSYFILFLILSSSMAFIVETIPTFHQREDNVWFVAEAVIVGIFTLEFVLRFASTPARTQFMKEPLNIIDLLAILPFYIEIIVVCCVYDFTFCMGHVLGWGFRSSPFCEFLLSLCPNVLYGALCTCDLLILTLLDYFEQLRRARVIGG